MNKISLIVPCFNEEGNVVPLYDEILKVFSEMKDVDFELMFVNDGSRDGTYAKIAEMHEKDSRVKCISFARNFGKEAALFAGIRNVSGDCTVFLDADLQHPPVVIKEMYAKWLEGFKVVEGVKARRGRESFVYKILTSVFYGIINRAVGLDMKNSSDYKLLDRSVIDELAKLKERNTFFRALSFWVGFNKAVVYYDVEDRKTGKTKWSTKSLVKYAIKNIVCFSYAPLKLVAVIGLICLLLGIGFGIDTLVSFFQGKTVSGYPTLVFILLCGFGGILLSLGIIGVYIAQIYDEIKGRPQYIIGDRIE